MRRPPVIRFAIVLLAFGLLGCGVARAAEKWGLDPEPVRVVKGFQVPECVVYHPATGAAYVSNIEGSPGGRDGRAFISKLKPDGSLDTLRWRASRPGAVLNAPKGMCILGDTLYVADLDRVHAFDLKTDRRTMIRVPGARGLNDLATDGKAVYVSDTGRGQVVRLDTSGGMKHAIILAPPYVNGITFRRGKLFAVSWTEHDLYELDPGGRHAPRPFGLARHFRNLDGIEVLEDGTFLVTDYGGHKICTVSPDRRTVRTLAKLSTPADLGFDRQGLRLFIPQLESGRVAIYQLRNRLGRQPF